MNRRDWLREEADALDIVARCSDAADTLLLLLDIFKKVPWMHRKIIRLSLLIVDVKRLAQEYRNEAGAQITPWK